MSAEESSVTGHSISGTGFRRAWVASMGPSARALSGARPNASNVEAELVSDLAIVAAVNAGGLRHQEGVAPREWFEPNERDEVVQPEK
jgi:hypothetical protein